MTVAEVAALLRLNQQSVRNWLDDKKLPHLRVGRRVRILRSDLERLIESGYRHSADAGRPGPTEEFWEGEMREPETPAGAE